MDHPVVNGSLLSEITGVQRGDISSTLHIYTQVKELSQKESKWILAHNPTKQTNQQKDGRIFIIVVICD